MKKMLKVLVFLIVVAGIGYYGFTSGLPMLQTYLQNRFAEQHAMLEEDDYVTSTMTVSDGFSMSNVVSVNTVPTLPEKTSSSGLWKKLAKTKLEFKGDPDNQTLIPEYLPEVKALEQQTVTVSGFMFPLENGEKQKHFLISPYPSSCPFCLPAGPTELIEVFSDEPVEFSMEEIKMEGVFGILKTQEKMQEGMLFVLTKARSVK